MLHAQTIIPLYDGKVPNSIPCNLKEYSPLAGRVAGITIPTLTVYIPTVQDSFKTAVIICPGGGYTRLSIDHEGYEVAKEFNKHGVTAFVLKYRIPNDSCMTNKETVPLQDAEQAIKLIREKAKEYAIDVNRVGIIGFSAGGHLAATISTHFNYVVIDNKSNTNLRPDFSIIGYPVISFIDSLAHKGSKDNLLGKKPTTDLVNFYSNELQVTSKTSPTFIVHAADDKTVKVENSIQYFEALQLNHVPSEIHVYQNGGHGFGLHNATTQDQWFDAAIAWLIHNKMMKGDVKVN